MKRVAVVGGGISGLAAAHRLVRAARDAGAAVETLLLEASPRLGGKIRTERVGGLALEAGPDSFLTSARPHALELVRELGLEGKLLPTSPRHTALYVYASGRLRRMPEGLLLMAPSRVLPFLASDLLSWPGKLRMALDLVLPRGGDAEESMGGFTRRRFGAEALERIVQPVMAGIYGGDADAMSLRSTFPKFLELERAHRSVILGLRLGERARARAAKPRGVTPFVTLSGGLGELVDALAASLGPAVRTGSRVRRIARTDRGYRLSIEGSEPLDSDALILTGRAWETAELLQEEDPELGRVLREIPFTSTATVSLAYERQDAGPIPPGFGFVVAPKDVRAAAAATFTSYKFPGRTPGDTVLIRCFLGGAGREATAGLPEEEMLAETRADLNRILGLKAAPRLARAYRWPRANPQYAVGHSERLRRIESLLARHPGLRLAGSSYRGVGLPDCIASGAEAAAEALRFLAGS